MLKQKELLSYKKKAQQLPNDFLPLPHHKAILVQKSLFQINPGQQLIRKKTGRSLCLA
jgi:hypothetical protein